MYELYGVYSYVYRLILCKSFIFNFIQDKELLIQRINFVAGSMKENRYSWKWRETNHLFSNSISDEWFKKQKHW